MTKFLDNSKKTIRKYFEQMQSEKFYPGKTKIPLAVPPYSWEEVSEALDSLLTMNTTMGKKVKKFEEKFAKYIGVKHAIMVNSGSSANLLALSILSNDTMQKKKIKAGDEIITPALTWATTVYPIANIGAKPVFVDVDLDTRNINTEKIESAITKKTKAIMPVHLLGYPCNMEKIMQIAKKHDLYVIEDACEAPGTEYFGKKVGSFGDLASFSFFASHHITTMEGGMLVTNNTEFYELGKSLRAFGWIRDIKNKAQYIKKNPKIDPRFLFINTGYNMRPTEIQGAFGIHQIKKLDGLIKIRIKIAKYWNNELKPYSEYFILPLESKRIRNTYMAYPITVKKNKYFTKNDLVQHLEKNKIETRPVMAGDITQQPVIKYIKHRNVGSLINSQYITNNSFLIGIHQNINKQMEEFVINTIIKFVNKKIK